MYSVPCVYFRMQHLDLALGGLEFRIQLGDCSTGTDTQNIDLQGACAVLG
jgi:hypothetical protein